MSCYNAVSCQWMNEWISMEQWWSDTDKKTEVLIEIVECHFVCHMSHIDCCSERLAGNWLPKPWHIFVSCKCTVHLVVCMYQNWSWTGGMGQQGLDLCGSVKYQWQAILNIVIHLCVLWDVGNFLTLFTKGSFLLGMSRWVDRSVSWLQNFEWKTINRKDKLDKVGLP